MNKMLTVAAVMAYACAVLAESPVRWWCVPAMSDRPRLPNVVPNDGREGHAVLIDLARDEYEPGSFVVRSGCDLGKVTLELSTFKTDDGQVFPADGIDLKVVKVWYQNENAWYSYFGDTGRKLCPELLLNDEDLVRVDESKEANYARLTAADGSEKERWINPPHQIDKGYWGMWRGSCSFSCMKPNFCDAETLQPVALPKDVSKQFFLTVHATKDTPAGLYRGRIELKGKGDRLVGAIPAEIRVRDFVLPRPKCYFDETKDFLVNFYSYDCYSMIMEENGGDLALAKRQFLATIKNRVAHGEDVYWFRWELFSDETRECLQMLKMAGMRTDFLVVSVPMPKKDATDAEIEAHFLDIAAKADDLLGHHNIYVCYGDEPGPSWLVKVRPIYKAVQNAGMKLIIAGSDNVFRKAGFVYDWHNVSATAENGHSTGFWNQLGTSPHVAWYSQQHVGPENPAFNRRQNGLAAYLSGYSALCNYAHHYGTWNDDTSGYRPMVFAYGHHRGVIDTLQWEGFREGVDDIRYATLLVTLARQAAKSENVEARYAANLALQYLATVDKASDDLDACRSEMVTYIERLLTFVGEPAPEPKLKCCRDTASGLDLVKPFTVYTEATVPEGRGKLLDQIRWELTRGWGWPITDKDSPAYYMNWPKVIADWELYRRISLEDKRPLWYGVVQAAVVAYAGEGKFEQARATLRDGLAGKRTPEETYTLKLMDLVLSLVDEATPEAVVSKLEAEEPKLAAGLKPKDHQDRFERAAALGVISCRDSLARGVAAYYQKLLPPRAEKKRYVVRAATEAERQPMDRKYGGAGAEFLATDVASGDRGNAADNNSDGTDTTVDLQVNGTERTLDFTFTIHDVRARQYEAGELDGGSFECYLAAGRAAPYCCFMAKVAENARPTVFNTMYDHAGFRRMSEDGPLAIGGDVSYGDDRIVCRVSMPWAAFAEKIPEKGDEWDFEAIYWGAKPCTWNGTDQVHGRSTWGTLAFDLGGMRTRILRKQLFTAVANYRSEKNPRGNWKRLMRSGLFDYWQDAVTGDPAFYAECLKPLEDELDAVSARISSAMSDRDVEELSAKWLSAFRDVGYTIQRMRTHYLERRAFGR